MKWNEEMIRAELKRLDEITGLQAGYLPIRIDNDYKDEFVAAYLVRDEKPYVLSRAQFEQILREAGVDVENVIINQA